MDADPIAKRLRTVYQKDLYEDYFSMNVRIESDKLEDGDKLYVTIRKVPDRATEGQNSNDEGEDRSTYGELVRSTVVRLLWRLWELRYGR